MFIKQFEKLSNPRYKNINGKYGGIYKIGRYTGANNSWIVQSLALRQIRFQVLAL